MQDLPFLVWLMPLLLVLGGLFFSTYNLWLWQNRKILGQVLAGITVVSMIFVGWMPNALGAALMLLAQSWLVLVCCRLVFGRLDEQFLKNSTRLNVILAIVAFFAAVAIAWLGGFTAITVGALALGVAVGLLAQTFWTLKHFKVKNNELSQKPTVSVCIPARNEDDVLMACIDAALKSDYQKLEILVLDDCSQDKTAEIIKSYAHDGVRFIKGDLPASGWLGKTQAMQTLAEHANGEWLLFIGVDTDLGEKSISKLMAQAVSSDVKMISVLPQNLFGAGVSTVFSTLQYFWQIAMPIGKRRVPVSGKMWLIQAASLKELGGFASVKHKILPEMSFARRLFSNDKYRFLIADSNLEVMAAKLWRGQLRTSVRLLYPTFKRQPYFALFGFAAIAVLILSPFVMMPIYLAIGNLPLFLCSIITIAILLICYGLVLFRTHPQSWAVAVLCLPFVLIQELGLIIVSMLSYEFGQVEWKDRNICYPVISQGRRSQPLSMESKR